MDSTSGNISKETQNTDLKEHMHPCVHCSVAYNSQDLEAAQVPIREGGDETLWCIHTMGYYSTLKKSYFLQQHGWTWRVLCVK